MRSYLWCLVLPAFLNCSGENIVAGKDETKAEQLASSLPKWCQQACARLEQCEIDEGCECSGDVCSCSGVDEDCAEDCAEELGRWANGGDECASVGERIKRCIDDLGCDVLGANGGDCNGTSAERDACQKADDDPPMGGSVDPGETPPLSGTAGSYTGPIASAGSVGYAGSASAAGGAPSYGGTGAGGTGVGGPPVSCQAHSMLGQAGSATSPKVCEESYVACSDNHQYGWYCVRTGEYQNVCSCLLDGEITRSFEWEATCPDVLEVNVVCGFNLEKQSW